jgi:catechol 2,3-dioxygenase-like lactoylglutathione lyase family enzyme
MSFRPTGLYCMLNVQDMDRAVRFWTDTFGLKIKSESPFWSELTFGDAVIALHGDGDGSETETGLGFDVNDIYAATQDVVAAGGICNWGPNEQPDEGIALADFTDPDGNHFMLSASL